MRDQPASPAGMLPWDRAVLSGGTTRVSLLLYLNAGRVPEPGGNRSRT